MNLRGRYELILEYELPDGNFVSARDIVDFFLDDNFEALYDLEASLHDSYIFFDDSRYGILNKSNLNYKMTKCLKSLGYLDSHDKIIKPEELLKLLKSMSEDASDLCNNMKVYERDVKIKMIEDEGLK
jgi:hypothetical protein